MSYILLLPSALEAGVNVRGADILIIPDATTCGRASLTQQVVVAEGSPGTQHIYLWVNENECDTSRLIEDPETYFREGGGNLGLPETLLY